MSFMLCSMFVQDESKLYIFLELVTKGSLRSLYQKYTLRDSQVSAYTRQILHGMKYLHDRNVVHRWLQISFLILFHFPLCIYDLYFSVVIIVLNHMVWFISLERCWQEFYSWFPFFKGTFIFVSCLVVAIYTL